MTIRDEAIYTGRESRFLPTPPAFDSLVRGPRWNIATTYGMEKTKMMQKLKIGPTFITFDGLHERDRRSDGQMDTALRHRLRLGIASRGKTVLDTCNVDHPKCQIYNSNA